MNIAVLKIGSRIAISSKGTSGGTGEVLSIIKILTNGGANVTAFTKVLDKDNKPSEFSIKNIEESYEEVKHDKYDALLVVNGNCQFFGGAEDRSQILNYHIINHFDGPVFYALCDCALTLKQVWPSIEKKPWASNYKKEDIYIAREDITYISQARDTAKVVFAANKGVTIKKAVHFPFEKFPLLTLSKFRYPYVENPLLDIAYGGTFRSGRREKDMIKFMFGLPEDIKAQMFGKITLDDFNKKLLPTNSSGLLLYRAPEFSGSVPYDEYPKKMSSSLSTIIIGDPIYKEMDDLAQRIYESIMIGNITFIDSSYDFHKRVYTDPELIKMLYVSNRTELADKIKQIKENPDLRKHIVDLQRSNTKIDLNAYSKELIDICSQK